MNVDNNNLYYDSSEAENLSKYIVEPDITVATPEDGRKDYIFKDAINRAELVGTMPENTDINERLELDSEYIIPKGYHDGTGRIYTGTLSDYTYGTAVPEHVANNEIFWVNGERLKGTLDLDMNDQVGNATSDDILEDMIAWVNRKKVVGTIPVLPRHDESLMAGQSYQLPRGYEGGESIISAVDLATQTPGDITAMDVPVGKVGWANGEKIEGAFDIDAEIEHRMAGTDATMEDVKQGKGFYSNKLGLVTYGTMHDHTGEEPRELLNGQTFNIPEGYYDGNSQITVKALKDITVASATAKDILLNKTAWVNGELVVGEGYQYVTDATDTTATEYDITEGKTAYIEGHKVTGKNTYDFTYWKSYDTNNFDDTPVAISVPISRWATIGYIRVDVYDDNGLSILSTYERETLYAGETFTFDNDNIIINSVYGDNEIHIHDKLGRKFAITCIGYTITGRPSQGSEVPVVSMLLPGPDIQKILCSKYDNRDFRKFLHNNTIPTDTETFSISQPGYEPVLIWYDTFDEENIIIYWGSKADQIFMNPDSSYIFDQMSIEEIDIDGWRSDMCTTLKYMFGSWASNPIIYGTDNWNTQNVTDISDISSNAYKVLPIEKWNLENVEKIDGLFSGCEEQIIDLTKYNFGNKISYISSLFSGCTNLVEIKGAEIFDDCTIMDASQLFYNNTNLSNFELLNHIHFGEDANYSFVVQQCPNAINLDFSNCNLPGTDAVVAYCDNLTTLNLSNASRPVYLAENIVATNNNINKLIYKNNIIEQLLTSVSVKSLDITGCKLVPVNNKLVMASSFNGLEELIGYEDLDVSHVTAMHTVFMGSRFDIDISKWKFSNLTDLIELFNAASGYVKIVGADTSTVTNMQGMFVNYPSSTRMDGTTVTEIDIVGLNTSNVTNMRNMFSWSRASLGKHSPITTINLTGIDTSNVIDMSSMFEGRTGNVDIIGLESLNVSNVTNMSRMFYDTHRSELDISGWSLDSVTNMSNAFDDSIKIVYCTEETENKIKSFSNNGLPSDVEFRRPSTSAEETA